MSALFNQTNIAPGTSFAGSGGGGGGSYPANPNFSTISLQTPTVGGGNIYFVKDPGNPGSGTNLVQSYWPGQSGFNFTPTYIQFGNAFCDMIGAQGMRITSSAFNAAAFGEIVGSNDGYILLGKDNAGNITQVWAEARDGFHKLNCVSTITDSGKTSTINVDALVSTLASAYPGTLSPYS